jgi:hypothetical protein
MNHILGVISDNAILIIMIVCVVTSIVWAIWRDWHDVDDGRGPPTFALPPDMTGLRVWILRGCPPWVHTEGFKEELIRVLTAVQCVLDEPLRGPLDLIFEYGHRKCGRKWANGCYSPANGPDRPAAIWLSTGYDHDEVLDCGVVEHFFAPKKLTDMAIIHELGHHGGFTDSKDSAKLAVFEREVRRALAGGDAL